MSNLLVGGSKAEDFSVGDKFIVVKESGICRFKFGQIIELIKHTGNELSLFTDGRIDQMTPWGQLVPFVDVKSKSQDEYRGKLADGSDCVNYIPGDEFILAKNDPAAYFVTGSVLEYIGGFEDHGGSMGYDWFKCDGSEQLVMWQYVLPTSKTLTRVRKVKGDK